LRELALHLLDIAHNSVSAKASNITITVVEDTLTDRLRVSIADDGVGMDAQTVQQVTDPFFTSRTTRNVGLGIPLLKAAAESCEGSLSIQSIPGKGTLLTVEFQRSHIDRMPMGDLPGTILSLIVGCPQVHWKFLYQFDNQVFEFDDALLKIELEGISLTEPVVLNYLRQTLEEGLVSLQLT
jgi:hypothetical protein